MSAREDDDNVSHPLFAEVLDVLAAGVRLDAIAWMELFGVHSEMPSGRPFEGFGDDEEEGDAGADHEPGAPSS